MQDETAINIVCNHERGVFGGPASHMLSLSIMGVNGQGV